MKKLIFALTCFILVNILVPLFFTLTEFGTFTPDPKIEIQNKVNTESPVPLRVVADYDFSPYSFLTEDNTQSGLDIELLNEIANRLGMQAEITFTSWPQCKQALNSGKADLILGLEIFSHMTGVLKTVPASEDQLVVFGKSIIHDAASLKGKKVALMSNSIITRIFDLNCEFAEYYTNSAILEAVEKGEVDYGICHRSVAMKIIEKTNYRLYPSITLMNSYPAIGVRDDLPELKNKINDILSDLSSEGFIAKLDEKWLVKFTKHPTFKQVYQENAAFYNTFIASFFVGIVLFIILFINKKNKMERDELIMVSTIDELTRLYNRHAYVKMLDSFNTKKIKELTVVQLDVNGLKAANDNIGHAAGDELICGAAACIQKIFGKIGFCYRTGGDEFTVLIEDESQNSDEIRKNFKNTVAQWKGVHVPSLTVSIGIAGSKEIENFDMTHFQDLLQLADKRMYSDKSEYYISKGIDRRSR